MTEERAQRILVIDDEVTQRILVKEYLEEAGYVVRLSDDGKKGLKMAATTKPDLIILDWMLPSLDGQSLCTSLKQTEGTSDIPIILITASREPDVIEQGLAAGADDFVTKPVDWAFLADRVSYVLERAHQKSEMARQLRALKEIEQNKANDLAAHSEQSQSLIDDRVRVVEEHAAQEIEAIREQASAELAAADERHARQLEAVRLETETRLAQSHGTLMSKLAAAEKALAIVEAQAAARIADVERHSRDAVAAAEADHNRLIETLREENDRQVRAIMRSSQNEIKAAEEDFAARSRALQDDVEQKLRDASDISEEARSALEADCQDRTKACWEIAYASSVSHVDLVSSLAGRLSATAAQLRGTDAQHAVRDNLLEAERLAKALLSSLGSLRLLTQVMSDRTQLKEESVDVTALVAKAATMARKTGESQRVFVRARVPQQPITMHADESRLMYALGSLSLNAIRLTPQGGTVELALERRQDGSVSLEIADQSVGLAPGQLETLRNCLDRPSRTLGPVIETFGLSIPIATALARQHGGHVEIESTQGSGTRVAFVLPAQRLRTHTAPEGGTLLSRSA